MKIIDNEEYKTGSKHKLLYRFSLILDRLKEKYRKLPTFPKLLVTSLPFVFSISIIAFVSYKIITDIPDGSNLNISQDIQAENNNNDISINLDNIENPKTHTNPINGNLMSKEQYEDMIKLPPIGIMMDNQTEARMQSGLDRADIVYETLVEGGITRYMPIFWTNSPTVVGPVRSARAYHVSWIAEYDAILGHRGYALSTNPDVSFKAIAYTVSLKDMEDTLPSWRSSDKPSPHNLYTSIIDAKEVATEMGYTGKYTVPSYSFKNDANYENRGDINQIEISFIPGYSTSNDYVVNYKYDKDNNFYKRSIGGEIHIDAETNIQLSPKTIIVQFCKFEQTFDSSAHVIFNTTGTGDAKIFMDGKEVSAKWEKESHLDRTTFTNSNTGKEIVFNRGQIWISILPEDRGTITVR